MGVDAIGALFSGDVKLEPQALQSFYNERVTMEDSELKETLDVTLDYLAVAYESDELCALFEKVLPKLYKEIGYDIILSSYGSFPSIWSCVGSEYYAKADKTYISPDNRIDMSTSVLRDTTWIEYNSRHNDFHSTADTLMKAWFDSDDEMTVHSDPDFPQYLVLENEAYRPMTASDVPNTTFVKATPHLKSCGVALIKIFAAFFA